MTRKVYNIIAADNSLLGYDGRKIVSAKRFERDHKCIWDDATNEWVNAIFDEDGNNVNGVLVGRSMSSFRIGQWTKHDAECIAAEHGGKVVYDCDIEFTSVCPFAEAAQFATQHTTQGTGR